MKIESVEQLEATLGQHEATAAVVDFVKAIREANEKFTKEIEAKENMLKTAEQAKAENEKRNQELVASLETVKKQLAEIQNAQAAAEANQKYQDRMSMFNEKFELDDEDRKLIASDIRDLDDAAFETYAAKCDKLMAAKKKGAKKGEKPGDKPCDKEPDKDEDDKAKAAKAAAEAAQIKAALASVKAEDQTKIPNGATVDEDLKARLATSFADSVLIDGKTVAERKAARTKKSTQNSV